MKCREINSALLIQEMTKPKNAKNRPALCLVISCAVFLACASLVFLITIPKGLWVILALAGYLLLFCLCAINAPSKD